MNEGMPSQNNMPEENKETKEERDKRGEEAEYLKNNPKSIPSLEKPSYNEEYKEKIEELFSSFEEKFPIDQLMAIETKEEALESSLREGSKIAFKDIHKLVLEIRDTTDVSPEERDRLLVRRKKLSMAVGIINSGKCRHE